MNVGTGYVVFWYRVSQDGYVTNYMIAFMDIYISFRCTYVGAMIEFRSCSYDICACSRNNMGQH